MPASVQLELPAPLRELDRDDIPDPPPIRRIVKASEAPPLPLGVPSIFHMAGQGLSVRVRCAGSGPVPLVRIERDGDRVRVVRIRAEDTAEWQEREASRRARQKPPRPVAKAKTRGKKVRLWDGEVSE